MLDIYRGILLGAAVGDALGMPYETSPPSLVHLRRDYAKPPRMHPNAGLRPGSYTDDTQIALLAAELLVNGKFTPENYANALKEMYLEKRLRFPDGAVVSACRRLMLNEGHESGSNSTTSGCVPLAVPFALACSDREKRNELLSAACSVTHTNPAAIAGTIWLSSVIRRAAEGGRDPLKTALAEIYPMEKSIALRIGDAVMYAEEEISMESALRSLGNDVSVFKTLPLAAYLITTYGDDPEMLYYAAQTGGNTDTIAFICGAWLGATAGESGIPAELIEGLENREPVESAAEKLYTRFGKKD